MSIRSDIGKTLRYAGRNGVIDTYYAARERIKEKVADLKVSEDTVSEDELARQRRISARLSAGETPEAVFGVSTALREAPLISLLVPAYETPEPFLLALMMSVFSQTYGNWELVIADASLSDRVSELANRFDDSRIVYKRLSSNGGISANTNEAAVIARGDYVAFLDHDDMLTPDAVFEIAKRIMITGCEIVYSDEDKCDEAGKRFFERNIKPDFNLDYLLANNYICHFLAMRRGLFLALKLRSEFDGAQDYDLLLRAPKSSIEHVPRILYHWRVHSGSTAGDPQSKDYAVEAGKRALESYFSDAGVSAVVSHSRHRGFYRIDYEPDLFGARADVGVIGGKVLNRHHRIIGGAYNEEGKLLFAGLHERESGPSHRADTRQDVSAVDVRCMKIRPELEYVYEEVFHCPYSGHVMLGSEDYRELSIEFCRRAAQIGYLVVFEPAMTRMV